MTMLDLIRDRGRQITAESRKARRSCRPAIDALEQRKVLSTTTTSGAFDGMTYQWAYDNVAKAGTMTVTDAPGNHTIDIYATHPNLSPGDPGYSPAHTNDIVGLEMADRQNDLTGGVSFPAGTKVNVVVARRAGDNGFVNDEPSFGLAYTARAATAPSPTPTPKPPSSPAPLQAQSGSSLGLAWRLAPDSSGGGTLYVQDVAKGSNKLDPGNSPIAINQDNGHVIFDVDYTVPYYGPAVAPHSSIKVVVAAAAGDIKVYDDRSGGGGFRSEARFESGSVSMMNGQSVGWTIARDVAAGTATVTFTSAAADRNTYWITPQHLDLSPGDPGYVANSNPVVGVLISDSQNDQGGPSFDQGTIVTIATKGGATFKRSGI